MDEVPMEKELYREDYGEDRRKLLFAVLAATLLVVVVLMLFFLRGTPFSPTAPFFREDDQSQRDVMVYGPGQKRHLLLGDDTTHIIVEVDYVTGFSPSDYALDTLEQRIRGVGGKSVTIILGDELPASSSSYIRDDLVALEKEHRDYIEQDGGTASIYVLYLNGVYDGRSGVLGVAYNGTSMAIMKEQVDGISIPRPIRWSVSTEDFEASVIVHEVGHLWGLVNIGYTSERDYEDPDYPHHSKHNDCVMYWAVETRPGSYKPWEDNKPPTTFHEDALFDIEMIKAGIY